MGKVKTTFRGGGGDDGSGREGADWYEHQYPRVTPTLSGGQLQHFVDHSSSLPTSGKDDSQLAPQGGSAGAIPDPNTSSMAKGMGKPSNKTQQAYRWDKAANQALDREYDTHPNSPLHTNQRFPD